MKIFFAILGLSTVALIVWPASGMAAPLRAGAAAVEITPAPGTPLAGYYNTRLATTTNDPISAKAIVIDDGQTQVALVGLDLISTTRPMVEEARRLIHDHTGIPPGNVMISATHCHTAPILAGSSVRVETQGGNLPIAAGFMARLPGQIAQAVAIAKSNLAPCRIRSGNALQRSISFNRRFLMKDGSVGWNPGKLNSNIVHAAGPIDPQVPVVLFESVEKANTPSAVYVNFSMHPDTVGGVRFSADYPGALSRALSEAKGNSLVTLFTIGTAGDLNHVDVTTNAPQKGVEEATRLGQALTAPILSLWDTLPLVPLSQLRVKSELVKLALPEITPAEVEEARAVALRVTSTNPPPPFLEQVNAFKVLDVEARHGEPQEVEVQVIALGDRIAWVSLPGEIFVELGLEIKRRSPFRQTIIAELANGAIGYIPTRRAYEQGNYEPVSARCAAGSGERLVAASLRLLNDLYPAQPAGGEKQSHP